MFDTEVTNGCVALDEPSSQEPSESYMCNECPESRVYKTQMDLSCHKALVHEAEANSKRHSKAYTCKYCKRKYMSLREYYQHPCKKRKKRNRPEHPPVQRLLKTNYTRRYKRHADGYVCCTCDHVAPSEDEIKTHWKSHIPSTTIPPRHRSPYPKKEPIYKCHICGKRFILEKYLTKHIEMHPFWTCKTCGKLFKSNMLLQTHERKHEPEFTRLCHLCGNMYKNLFKHMKNVHFTTTKPRKMVVCHICGIVINNYCLKRHIDVVHERVNPKVTCPLCQKTYVDEIAVKKHINKVHSTSNLSRCKFCNKAYKRKRILGKHIEKQHPACKICEKRFATEDAKNKHETLEHIEGDNCEQSPDTENIMQEHTQREERMCSSEDLQTVNASIRLVLTAEGDLLPMNC